MLKPTLTNVVCYLWGFALQQLVFSGRQNRLPFVCGYIAMFELMFRCPVLFLLLSELHAFAKHPKDQLHLNPQPLQTPPQFLA